LANRRFFGHHRAMNRLRFLSALLGCLTVVAASLSTMAWAQSAAAGTGHAAIQGLCTQHCPECEGMPCPPTAAGCVVACASLMPALVTASFVLAKESAPEAAWVHGPSPLHGLSPPPEPFPPRA
jgi:hypothetical protein